MEASIDNAEFMTDQQRRRVHKTIEGGSITSLLKSRSVYRTKFRQSPF